MILWSDLSKLKTILTDLAEISEAVGAKFTITACSGDMNTYINLFTFKMIAAYIAGLPDPNRTPFPPSTILASQHVQKKVLSLKLNQVALDSVTHFNIFNFLLRASREWSVQHLDFNAVQFPSKWDTLASESANGSIGTFILPNPWLGSYGMTKGLVQKVWKITEKSMQCVTATGVIEVKGGKGADTEDEWKGMLEFLET